MEHSSKIHSFALITWTPRFSSGDRGLLSGFVLPVKRLLCQQVIRALTRCVEHKDSLEGFVFAATFRGPAPQLGNHRELVACFWDLASRYVRCFTPNPMFTTSCGDFSAYYHPTMTIVLESESSMSLMSAGDVDLVEQE
jgi:hypothetical protein